MRERSYEKGGLAASTAPARYMAPRLLSVACRAPAPLCEAGCCAATAPAQVSEPVSVGPEKYSAATPRPAAAPPPCLPTPASRRAGAVACQILDAIYPVRRGRRRGQGRALREAYVALRACVLAGRDGHVQGAVGRQVVARVRRPLQARPAPARQEGHRQAHRCVCVGGGECAFLGGMSVLPPSHHSPLCLLACRHSPLCPLAPPLPEVEKLMRGKYQDNLENMQWFKHF